MSGLRSKRKGKSGEREAAAVVRQVLGVDARRGQQFTGGEDSPDILTELSEIHFEVKRSERLRLYEAIEQAASDAGGKIPVVLHRQNGRPWVVVLRLDDLPALARAIDRDNSG